MRKDLILTTGIPGVGKRTTIRGLVERLDEPTRVYDKDDVNERLLSATGGNAGERNTDNHAGLIAPATYATMEAFAEQDLKVGNQAITPEYLTEKLNGFFIRTGKDSDMTRAAVKHVVPNLVER